ncbi:MAG: SDR family oxidoreductase [Planctomycetota bacterium]|nr:SDR family oxidoreductase [Planctomycetota bacterium]
MAKKILITGTNSGFGRMFADTLLKNGHTVIAAMRDVEGRNAKPASELRAAGAHVVEIDVTDEASVEAGVAAGIEAAGGLDVLINNAGFGVVGLQETFTTDDWQRVFDVNVFGVQRMTRAALPAMRAQGSGLVMFVSSLLGRFVLPFLGPYNSSKWALEAMAENYRVELSALGIETAIVEPGAFGTGFLDGLMEPSDTDRVAQMGPYGMAPAQFVTGFEQHLAGEEAPSPQMVADATAALVDTPAGERPFRTTVDGLGMNGFIDPLNAAGDQATRGIYEAFEMSDMLKLKTPEASS